MATIEDYLGAQKESRNSVETLNRRIRQAYDAAQKETQGEDDTYDRLDKLVDEEARKSFKETFVSGLTKPIQKSINYLPEEPLFAENLAMNAYYGFTASHINSFLDSAKDKTSYDGFMGFLKEHTGYKQSLETRLGVASTILDKVSVQDVLKHVGLVCDTDARDKVDIQEKSELLNMYDQLKVIPPTYLEKKPHLRYQDGLIQVPGR